MEFNIGFLALTSMNSKYAVFCLFPYMQYFAKTASSPSTASLLLYSPTLIPQIPFVKSNTVNSPTANAHIPAVPNIVTNSTAMTIPTAVNTDSNRSRPPSPAVRSVSLNAVPSGPITAPPAPNPPSQPIAVPIIPSVATAPLNGHSMTTRAKAGIFKPKVRLFVTFVELTSAKRAMQDTKWLQAMKEEYDALIKDNTWTLVSLPPGREPIGCKWVFRIKYHPDGTINKYKARLVAKGFHQQEGFDFHEPSV